MTITYKEIKPLVADATFIQNRLLCKFQDPRTSQVVLSAADLPRTVPVEIESAGFLKRALAKFTASKDVAKSSVEEEAILKAFEKVSHLFVKENGRVRMKG